MTIRTPLPQESKDEWLQITPGERFAVRISSDRTKGAYTTLEIAADHRNGVCMHTIRTKSSISSFWKAPHTSRAGANLGLPRRHGIHGRSVPHAWCNLSESPLRMLVTFSPGRIEGLFRSIAKGGNIDFAALSEKFGVRIIGPTLVPGPYLFSSPRS